ncbi:hypothetical protein [Rossellomorea aquimaris]|uniref:hypothetical protein n=1 Tax=Rossellomorea aquimaris TaxID=189382 RepID=UPI0007D0868C|nr:hypothetical protein [Rossellomorea aquimaris]
MKFAKVIYYNNRGYRCDSPISNATIGSGNPPIFINRKINNLYKTRQKIITSEMTMPREEDGNWSGCFCYLNEHKLTWSFHMPHKERENRNIGFLPVRSEIWVRNLSHLEGMPPYFSHFSFGTDEAKSTNLGSVFPNTWVKMSVKDALERKRLWKEKYQMIPQGLTECFLFEDQIKELFYPSKEKAMEFWLSEM